MFRVEAHQLGVYPPVGAAEHRSHFKNKRGMAHGCADYGAKDAALHLKGSFQYPLEGCTSSVSLLSFPQGV